MQSSASCFSLQSVGKTIADSTILQDVSLDIARSALSVITGPSGSGKTTLLSLLGALDTPSCGQLLFEDRDIATLSADDMAALRNRAFGFVFQTSHYLPYLTVIENILLPLSYRSHASLDAKDISHAQALLNKVGLAGYEDRMPSTLSGGEQQRMNIARALIMSPQVIFADEPTAALDEENSHKVMQLFRLLVGPNCSVIVVSHDPLVSQYADAVYHFKHKGRDLVQQQ